MNRMPDDQVQAMQALCRQIEQAIERGEVAPTVAADLKSAIDETRMRVWASLESRNSGDPEWVQDFWIRRAAEVCGGVVARLERGEVRPDSPEAAALRAAASQLITAIGSEPK